MRVVAQAELYPLSHRRIWLVVILLALLLHALLLSWTPHFDFEAAHPRVEVNEVNPKKLEAIRNQWRKRNLLLDKNPKAKSDEAPADARYESDRNIKVEKEQRARQTDVVPRPFTPGTAEQQRHAKAARNVPKTQNIPLPNLGSLGVPFDLNRPAPEQTPDNQPEQQESQAGQPGGDQAILDRDLPVGGENMLNAQESVYYSFYARLYNAIGPIWASLIRDVPNHRRVTPGDYTTQVDVVFDESGNLVGVRQIQGSGISDFDQAVENAWKKVGQAANPPKGLLDANRQVHTGWTFQVHVDEGFNLQYSKPERNY